MRYVVRRLLQTLVVVFGVSIVAFGMSFLTGDPTEVILGDGADRMSVQQIQEFRHKMGFDRPWYVQYVSFVGKALQGDFGYSFIRHKPAYEVITERLPTTDQARGLRLRPLDRRLDSARRPLRHAGAYANRLSP